MNLGGSTFSVRAEQGPFDEKFNILPVQHGASGRVCFKYSKSGENEGYGIILGGNSARLRSSFRNNLNNAWNLNQQINMFDSHISQMEINFR